MHGLKLKTILLLHSRNEDDVASKHENEDEVEEEGAVPTNKDPEIKPIETPKESDSDRPSSSGKFNKMCLFAIEQLLRFPEHAGIEDEADSVIGITGGSAAGSITGPATDELIWPSMQDLNTRLRRVITSYQRNYKKEELKQQQKAKVISFIFS